MATANTDRDGSSTKASPAELRASALDLVPAIEAQADQAEAARDVAPSLIDEIRQADLLRMFQPSNWGGLEADPRTFYDVQNIFSEASASVGWVYGVLAIQSFIVALFDERAQAEMWGGDSQAVACSSLQALGVAAPTDDGYRLKGRWTFSSGSTHAQWAMVGASIEGRQSPPGIPPLVCLIPRDEYQVIDTWQTFGLRATGSHDLEIDGVFVPEYRTLALAPGLQPLSRAARPGPALYRLPWLYLFTSSISNFSIGTARAALSAFLEINATKASGLTGKVAKEDPEVQRTAARMQGAIDAVDAMYERHIALLFECTEHDRELPIEAALLLRLEMTSAVRRLAAICDEMMLLLGGRGIFTSSSLTRIWLDLMAARNHIGNNPSGAEGLLGKSLLESAASGE